MTYYKKEFYDNGTYLIGVAVNSSESKPTASIVQGSEAIETDTGNYYLYDGTTWNLMCTIKEEA